MKNINRRQWLKSAGLTSSIAVLGGINVVYAGKLVSPETTNDDLSIKLNSNENPFGPSENVRNTMIEAFNHACRYPFGYIEELAEAIAKKEGLTSDHIVITGGSTEGLKITGLTYGIENGEIIAADPTFQSMLTYASQWGAYINRVPLNDNMVHDLNEMDRRITQATRLIFICNPNNPTGTILEASDLKTFCEVNSKRTVIFSDEAYYDYITEPGYPSMVELVKQGQNVIVSRTFSKIYGLAGVRIGYLVARPDIASRLNKHVVAGTNVLAIAAALTSLNDNKFYQFSKEKNMEAKSYLYSLFDEMGLNYIKSHTNFVFFHTGRPITDLIKEMRDKNVYIGRPFPPLFDWCRISTGTMNDMKSFGTALKSVI